MTNSYVKKRASAPKTRRFGGSVYRYKTSCTSMQAIDKVKASLKKAGYKVRAVKFVDHTDMYYRK